MQEVLEERFFGNDSGEGTIIDPSIHKDGNTDIQEMDPLKDNLRLVEKGRLDSKTGMHIPLTSKGNTIVSRNLCPSQKYLDNFDQIKWDEPPKTNKRKGYKVRKGVKWYV